MSQPHLFTQRNVRSEVEPGARVCKNQSMPRLLVATRNSHKTAEIRAILGSAWEIEDLTAFPEIVSPEETGTTFAENAAIKALSASRIVGGLALGEDSGLEVDALGGAPGVFSARYAGPSATDAENRAKLIQELARCSPRAPEWNARFRCAMTLARAGRLLTSVEGELQGRIADAERGANGFGYDPLFIPNGYSLTFGELSASLKNQLSHRARALQLLRAFLNGYVEIH